jgi:L-amino acid N-acyltransferase YncA
MSRGQLPAIQLPRVRAVHRKMSAAAFKRLPRRLGWKYEYFGDKVHITPMKLFLTMRLELSPRPLPRHKGIRPVTPADAKALEKPFLAAFARTSDYADYPTERFRECPTRYLEGFFGTVRGEWAPVSVLAEVEGQIIGAALVKHRDGPPLLDCLFIHPAHARQGWGTALVSRVVQGLLADGEKELISFVHLANEGSKAWHLGFGFKEMPDLWVASYRARFYSSERQRHGELEDLSAEELARLEGLADFWSAEVKRLEKMEREDYWSVHPLLA